MLRRLYCSILPIDRAGFDVTLDPSQSRHARDVLRLSVGEAVELFDDAGAVADGSIAAIDTKSVSVHVERVVGREELFPPIVVASAVPKGDRADWMVEKLSEIGVAQFIPLATRRSVALPEGSGKRDRWTRLAMESAKQSRRAGVMRIDPLTSLGAMLAGENDARRFVCSLEPGARLIVDAIPSDKESIMLIVGPEGGWTDEELVQCREANVVPVKLTPTVLRIETAAVVAAGLTMSLLTRATPADGTQP